ncbi:MAG TPA: 3-hydroxyacyl-CoA dehydrogenase family protein [Hanamia sp.]|nr:3-hydroxyacyl-CoA dehydrogenase family protein [Hanamia sp.]
MNIFILADEQQKKEILTIHAAEQTSVTFAKEIAGTTDLEKYDAFFILSDHKDINFEMFGGKPVYVNQVIETLPELHSPDNVSRINAWPGFLERPLWEIVSNQQEKHEAVFSSLNRKIIFVKDEPGFVSARVISMIVNEAFFAFGENISSIEEIDMAMKLGTNYPDGPFEWAEKIGVENIYGLLEKLAAKEERYLPAPALKKLYLDISEKVDQ